MARTAPQNAGRGAKPSLVEKLVSDLRAAILDGEVPIGGKLPSEAALSDKHAVSRTVVREAVAALRSEGLVEPRQGAGVFVIGAQSRFPLSLDAVDAGKLSSLVEMMEFRIGVESEAAALAALRRSPAQEAAIYEAFDALDRVAGTGQPTGPLDFGFHLAVARATNNPRFWHFLDLLGTKAIPRAQIAEIGGTDISRSYHAQLQAEHRQIAAAITSQDTAAARAAMRRHLENGLRRYRDMRRETP